MPATQVYEKHLNPVAGYFGLGSLVKVLGVLAADQDKAVSGRCGYLDSATGVWRAGATPVRTGPPLFIFRGLEQADINNDGTSASGTIYWVAGTQNKRITCFVGTGGFEFQTTEYVTGTYNNGTALTVDNNGKLSPHTGALYGTTAVVGFCTPFQQMVENMITATTYTTQTPVGQNMHLLSVLNFHTHFVPST